MVILAGGDVVGVASRPGAGAVGVRKAEMCSLFGLFSVGYEFASDFE
jgi:hypothetical protein